MFKNDVIILLGSFGSLLAGFYGGWTSALTTLCILIVVDYLTGFIVGAIFKNSSKTETGGLSSKVGWKGLSKKVLIMLYVLIGQRLDMMMGLHYIKDSICIGFIINELISITENSSLMGVPVPPFISKAIDLIKTKEDTTND